MSKPEFPGTAVGLAMAKALEAWNKKLPLVSKELISVVERCGNISADHLSDVVDDLNSTFAVGLYEELKRQGVEVT